MSSEFQVRLLTCHVIVVMAVNSDSTPLFEPEEEVKDEFKKEKLYETFTDASEVKMIIDKMKSEYRNESSLELCEERFGVLIDKYQEQPHLLDPHLDGLLSELLTIAMSPATETTLTHQCFKFLYKITKVRGYKIIVRHLPHEVIELGLPLCPFNFYHPLLVALIEL